MESVQTKRLLNSDSKYCSWTIFTIILITCIFLSFFQIGNYWQRGFNGYSGAAFSVAARNSIRFGIAGAAQYHTGIKPPRASDIYIGHPMLLPHHITAMFMIFGEHEWAARMVPALYSILTSVLLFFIVRRLWNTVHALTAMALYVMLPINLIYANMVDHEQGSIFYCLLFIFFAIRYLEEYKTHHFILALASVSIACQFDWPAYYLSFLFFLYLLIRGLNRSDFHLKWTCEYTFALIMSFVVLLNFFLFFLFIYLEQGSFSVIIAKFKMRSSVPAGYWERVLPRIVSHYHLPALILSSVWIFGFVIRIFIRKISIRDIIPLFFLFTQITHQMIFRNAGFIHSYWPYHAAPFVAIASASSIIFLAQKVYGFLIYAGTRIKIKWSLEKVMHTTGIAVSSILVISYFTNGIIYSADAFIKGRTGNETLDEYKPHDHERILFAKEISGLTTRQETILIHNSFEYFVHFLYYLDRQVIDIKNPDENSMKSILEKKKAAGMIMDISNNKVNRSLYDFLLSQWESRIYENKFMFIDFRKPGQKSVKFGIRELESSIFHKWFVNYVDPPAEWIDE